MNDKFKIESGKMILTDPCYEKGTWCTKTIPARNGEWTVEVTMCGDRVAELIARHELYLDVMAGGENIDIEVLGVDSGQMGFFDESKYPKTKNDIGEYDEKGSFYGKCCDTTLSKKNYGAVDNMGCVSSTGYGDGSYGGFAETDENGDALYVEIHFIDVDDDGLEFTEEDDVN